MSIVKFSFLMPAELYGNSVGIQVSLIPSCAKGFMKGCTCIKKGKQPNATTSLDSEDLWSSISKYITNEGIEPGSESVLKENRLGLSDSFFEDGSAFHTEEEKPAVYSPPPPISEIDVDFNARLENALYILRDLLSGPVRKTGMENELSEAWMLMHDDVRVQDPILHAYGKGRFAQWLHKLVELDGLVNLHEIYAESINTYPREGCIYAVWTFLVVSRPDEISDPSAKNPPRLMLSGETKFNLDSGGQITSIQSLWHSKEEKVIDFIRKHFHNMLVKTEV